MAEGNNSFGKVFVLYVLAGGAVVILRLLLLPKAQRHNQPPLSGEHGFFETLITSPLTRILFVLVFITVLLPPNPWRHLSSTLLYEVVEALSKVAVAKAFYGNVCSKESVFGSNPLGNLNYNPAHDPYYISNLHQPIDEFIASALEDSHFTNIVHIVLESMREDSYPYQEDGLLNQHIITNMQLVKGGTPINTQTITPFIASLADHTLSWHTTWATIPYTHKTMLGCELFFRIDYADALDWCGMLPVPMDWSVEGTPPAKFYQHCLPQVLRYMSSVTDRDSELVAGFRNESLWTTDQWETTHIASSTGEWDHGKEIIKGTGMNSAVFAEQIAEMNGNQSFPSTFGYFDEGRLFWNCANLQRALNICGNMLIALRAAVQKIGCISPTKLRQPTHLLYFPPIGKKRIIGITLKKEKTKDYGISESTFP